MPFDQNPTVYELILVFGVLGEIWTTLQELRMASGMLAEKLTVMATQTLGMDKESK